MISMDMSQALQDQVHEARDKKHPLVIEGQGSKRFYGYPQSPDLARLFTHEHRGIIDYAPEELVIRARAGTRLSEINRLLGENNQVLAFEPPDFGTRSTIGGVIASGLSGPRRPYAGAARDFVLGVKLITGIGDILEFGGQVMKNVAGYDVSRLVTGAMGTLGVILDVSLKVLPAPEMEITRAISVKRREFQSRLQTLQRSFPVSAASFRDDQLNIRLSGSGVAVEAASRKIGGEDIANDSWDQLNTLTCFSAVRSLWRISVAPASESFLDEAAVIDWGGGIRWLADPETNPRDGLANRDGHATLMKFRGEQLPADVDIFHPLSATVAGIHGRLKNQFDPDGIFNPGRMYRDI